MPADNTNQAHVFSRQVALVEVNVSNIRENVSKVPGKVIERAVECNIGNCWPRPIVYEIISQVVTATDDYSFGSSIESKQVVTSFSILAHFHTFCINSETRKDWFCGDEDGKYENYSENHCSLCIHWVEYEEMAETNHVSDRIERAEKWTMCKSEKCYFW
ncbi:hypothetical protein GCK72_025083 [Caenorhabditis remanei]|uniref:Uncharacterized protein n=1 Tax=Caenorhabditis remanei TaxID=31234 RepID=A0A6A5G0Z4_CAERE|nr:hypothetical protein GCK72_025083 [Caenorhabditis remanei]KAF1748616.1 hypothetical protein GCK72_025083 [Caenorhabditis remanei]